MKWPELRENGLISVHISVLLFGLAGIFGKIIFLPAVLIVLGRVFFGTLTIAMVIQLTKKLSFRLANKKHFYIMIGLGVLLAFHWFSFFYSIQLSTVAIGLLTFASFPVFTAFIEPVFFREKFEPIYIGAAILVLIGVYLIIPELNLNNEMTIGAIWGIFSGLSFAFLTLLNRKYVKSIQPILITYYQDLFACIVLLPFLFLIDFQFRMEDLLLLILLGTVFTALAHFLYIRSLTKINARTASIISSLEPVYGILFAWIILHEKPELKTIIGGLIILLVAFLISMNKTKNK